MRHACVLVAALICSVAGTSSDSSGVSVVLKLYEECSRTDGLSPCLKKKALTMLDRLGRMERLTLAEGVTVVHHVDEAPAMTEEQLEATLPRAADARDDALTHLIIERATKFIGGSTLEISPRLIEEELEEGRDGLGGGKKGGLGGGKGGKKDMMGGLMMMVAAKLAGLIPIAIAGLFLLAGKALITAKVALLLSGIIALKKLFAAKGGQGGHVEHVHASPHGGGWESSGHGHGGWDKRSLDGAQDLAYKAYVPQS